MEAAASGRGARPCEGVTHRSHGAGGVAQLVERPLDKRTAAGSSPATPTRTRAPAGFSRSGGHERSAPGSPGKRGRTVRRPLPHGRTHTWGRGRIAQLEEQLTENQQVGSSNLPPSTTEGVRLVEDPAWKAGACRHGASGDHGPSLPPDSRWESVHHTLWGDRSTVGPQPLELLMTVRARLPLPHGGHEEWLLRPALKPGGRLQGRLAGSTPAPSATAPRAGLTLERVRLARGHRLEIGWG